MNLSEKASRMKELVRELNRLQSENQVFGIGLGIAKSKSAKFVVTTAARPIIDELRRLAYQGQSNDRDWNMVSEDQIRGLHEQTKTLVAAYESRGGDGPTETIGSARI